MRPFGSEKGAPCARLLKARGSQRWGRAEGSHPTTLVLDPAQQPLSEEVQRPAHNSSDELRHLGAQGLQGAGWASGIEPCPPCLETALPHLLAQPPASPRNLPPAASRHHSPQPRPAAPRPGAPSRGAARPWWTLVICPTSLHPHQTLPRCLVRADPAVAGHPTRPGAQVKCHLRRGLS